jgi:hypothetical protein
LTPSAWRISDTTWGNVAHGALNFALARAYLPFVAFDGAVVFEAGPTRLIGLLVTPLLLFLMFRHQVTTSSIRQYITALRIPDQQLTHTLLRIPELPGTIAGSGTELQQYLSLLKLYLSVADQPVSQHPNANLVSGFVLTEHLP